MSNFFQSAPQWEPISRHPWTMVLAFADARIEQKTDRVHHADWLFSVLSVSSVAKVLSTKCAYTQIQKSIFLKFSLSLTAKQLKPHQQKNSKPSLKNHSTYKMLVVLSISQKDYEHNTIPHRRNPNLFQNKETSAKNHRKPPTQHLRSRPPPPCPRERKRDLWKKSIKNVATYQQKSIFFIFFLLLSI
jgi:ribosomal protein S30